MCAMTLTAETSRTNCISVQGQWELIGSYSSRGLDGVIQSWVWSPGPGTQEVRSENLDPDPKAGPFHPLWTVGSVSLSLTTSQSPAPPCLTGAEERGSR